MAIRVNYVSVNGSATGTEDHVDVHTKTVVLLVNDGSADITFNFDNATTESNTIVLKSGEKLENLPISIANLYFKAASGTQAFRFIGLK